MAANAVGGHAAEARKTVDQEVIVKQRQGPVYGNSTPLSNVDNLGDVVKHGGVES